MKIAIKNTDLPNRIRLIRLLKESTDLSLKELKDLVDTGCIPSLEINSNYYNKIRDYIIEYSYKDNLTVIDNITSSDDDVIVINKECIIMPLIRYQCLIEYEYKSQENSEYKKKYTALRSKYLDLKGSLHSILEQFKEDKDEDVYN